MLVKQVLTREEVEALLQVINEWNRDCRGDLAPGETPKRPTSSAYPGRVAWEVRPWLIGPQPIRTACPSGRLRCQEDLSAGSERGKGRQGNAS
jgi:hypothetical protein